MLAFDDLDGRMAYEAWRLRQDVFVVEQACPYGDLDGRDMEPATRHVVGVLGGVVAGYARVLDEGDEVRIGRVVLVRSARGQGLADLVMKAAVGVAGDRPSVLDAQAALVGWYARFGYRVVGPEFVDDGIPHVPMWRPAQGRP